jgi:hypothetical protein
VALDFTDAVITHDTLRIDMNMHGDSLIMVTGLGLVVDADSLAVRYADVSIHPATGPGPNGPGSCPGRTLREDMTFGPGGSWP